MITLYTLGTPNGVKVSVALELLQLAYKTVTIDISTNIQKEDWFLKISPNGRIPAIVDTEGPKKPNGEDFTLMESGAILQYLAEKYDTDHKISFPRGTLEYYQSIEWLLFQNAGVGPMQGQANHFQLYAPEKVPYGIKRYTDETRRLYSVLNARLEETGTGFLVGNHVSIADITTVGWVGSAPNLGIDLAKEFPAVDKWIKALIAVPEIKKGLNVPSEWKNWQHFPHI